MISSRVLVGVAVALLAGIALAGVEHARDRQSLDRALFADFKHHCSVVPGTTYQNDTFGFRFIIREGLLACEYTPTGSDGSSLEIFVWRRSAFDSSLALGFGSGIVGKVMVNPLEGLPQGRLIAERSGVIAGTSTVIREEEPISCDGGDCPVSRVADLVRGGVRFTLEEYDDEVDLLRSFEFTNA